MSPLDRLLEEAREAAPEPLDDASVDAMLRAASAGAASSGVEASGSRDAEEPSAVGGEPPAAAARLDALLEAARAALPEDLDERRVRRMAARAAMTGAARHRAWTRRRLTGSAAVAAALAAAAVTLVVVGSLVGRPETASEGPVRRPVATPSASPNHLSLPTGDRIVAEAEARFGVELARADARRVRLDQGAMLFDVRPIEGGRFSVTTRDAEVVVLGTVFTVRADASGTTVRVYEGRVEVRSIDVVRVLSAGEVARVGAGEATADPLRAEARAAARRREAESSPPPSAPPASPARRTVEAAGAPSAEVARPGPEGSEPSERDRRVSPTASATASPTAADARRWIAEGDASRALAAARDATSRGALDPWVMLEGDALRALGRDEEAADVYRRAVDALPSPRREQAGFLEARLRAGPVGDPEAALRALREAEVTAPSSPLRERGLALEAQLLSQLGRVDALRTVAQRYLDAFPSGPRAEAMRLQLLPRTPGHAESPGMTEPPGAR